MISVGDYEYNVRDKIGKGAFGEVFMGRFKLKIDKKVAIKVLLDFDLKTDANEVCILKELTKLHHINLVLLMFYSITPDNAYLVMEVCPGLINFFVLLKLQIFFLNINNTKYCNGGDFAGYLKGKLFPIFIH